MEAPHSRMALPLRARYVHLKSGTENTLRVVEPRGSQDCSDGYRYVRHDMDRMPIELGDLLDRLSGKFRRSDIEENIGAGRPDRHHLRVHRWCAGFIGRTGDDHPFIVVSQHVLQSQNIVPSEIIVLVEHTYPGVRIMLKDIGCVDARFSAVVRLQPDRPRKMPGVAPA